MIVLHDHNFFTHYGSEDTADCHAAGSSYSLCSLNGLLNNSMKTFGKVNRNEMWSDKQVLEMDDLELKT